MLYNKLCHWSILLVYHCEATCQADFKNIQFNAVFFNLTLKNKKITSFSSKNGSFKWLGNAFRCAFENSHLSDAWNLDY